jgi:hypothetical protein
MIPLPKNDNKVSVSEGLAKKKKFVSNHKFKKNTGTAMIFKVIKPVNIALRGTLYPSNRIKYKTANGIAE